MSTLDVVAYAGEEHGGVKPANFLDIGGGASAEVMANGLEIVLSDPAVKSVFVNVFGGITACDEVANGIVQALALLEQRGEQVTKPLVVRLDGNNAEAGRRDPRRRGQPARRAGGHDGRRGRARRRARGCGGADMAIWLTKDSKVIVQGMTGSEGSKHTRRMLRRRHQRRRRRQPAQGRAAGRLRRHRAAGVRAPSPRRWRRPAPTSSVIFVPPAFTKAAVHRGDRRRASRWPS